LAKVKEYLVGNQKLELESSDAWASFYGGQEVSRKKIKSPEEAEQAIRKVTARQVRDLAKKIFVNKNLNLAVIGPYEDQAEFQKTLKW
jgi:predicted Zn-dependent peptidase